MFRGRFVGAVLAFLIIIGLFGLAGSSIYRAGWTQGYFVGKVSDGAEAGTTAVAPDNTPSQTLAPRWGYSPFGSFMGAIFKFFLFFLFLGMIFKFIGLLFWRKGRRGRHWGHKHGWGHGWDHSHHGQTPPWYDDQGDEPVMKA